MKSCISSKGQITVPVEIREKLGLRTGTAVRFELVDGGAVLRKTTRGPHPVDPVFGPASREALREAFDAGTLVACDVVWAEVRAHFRDDAAFDEAMEGLGIEFSPLSEQSARLAGGLWRRIRARGTPRSTQPRHRVVADFLIGAHAQTDADALLTRDRGFFRTYFKTIKLHQPQAPRRTRPVNR